MNLICHRGSLLQVLLAVRGGWMNLQQPSSSYTGNVVVAPREMGANCPGEIRTGRIDAIFLRSPFLDFLELTQYVTLV